MDNSLVNRFVFVLVALASVVVLSGSVSACSGYGCSSYSVDYGVSVGASYAYVDSAYPSYLSFDYSPVVSYGSYYDYAYPYYGSVGSSYYGYDYVVSGGVYYPFVGGYVSPSCYGSYCNGVAYYHGSSSGSDSDGRPKPKVVKCSDGTPAGSCSASRPEYCVLNADGKSGYLADRASICGCPNDGSFQSGNSCRDYCSDGTKVGECNVAGYQCSFDGHLTLNGVCPVGNSNGNNGGSGSGSGSSTLCAVGTNPGTVRDGSSTTVTISYSNLANAPQTARVLCGDGSTAIAQCSATGDSRDTSTPSPTTLVSECASDASVSLVCGADGNTYQNAQSAACAKTTVAFTAACANPAPQVLNVQAFNVDASRADLLFTTDVAGTTQFEYGLTNALGSSTVKDATLSSTHAATLTGLNANTDYFVRADSCNDAGCVQSPIVVFRTVPVPSSTAPLVLSGFRATTVRSTTATIAWSTNVASDSKVEYGTTTAYGLSAPLASGLVTAHSVSLSGLTADTTYHYRVTSCTAASASASAVCLPSTDLTFRTFPTTVAQTTVGPSDLGVDDSRVAANDVKFTVKSIDTTAGTAVLSVAYPSATGTPADSTVSKSSTVTIQNVKVSIGDIALVSGTATVKAVTLGVDALAIQGVSTFDVSASSATIGFSSNVPADASATIRKLPSPDTQTVTGTAGLDHTITFSNLDSGATYEVIVKSCPTATPYASCVTLPALTFTASAAPSANTPVAVFNARASSVTTNTAVVQWSSTVAGSSQVSFSDGTNTFTSTLDSTAVTAHSVTLSGLTPGVAYTYSVQSCDSTVSPAVCATSSTSAFSTHTARVSSTTALRAFNTGVSTVGTTTARVVFNSNLAGDTRVAFGDTQALNANAGSAALVTSHSVDLTGLSPKTTYYYQATTCTGATCVSSPVQSFVTASVSSQPNLAKSGLCTATCTYNAGGPYPQNARVDAFIDGLTCTSATERIVSPSSGSIGFAGNNAFGSSSGSNSASFVSGAFGTSILTHVTDCTTGGVLQGAKVAVTSPAVSNSAYASGVFTDANGEIILSQLSAGTYTLAASADGYAGATVSATAAANLVSVANVCLKPSVPVAGQCSSFTASIAGTPPVAGTSDNLNQFQLFLRNTQPSTQTFDLTYSLPFPVNGPTSVTLNANTEQIVTVGYLPDKGFAGGTNGVVSIHNDNGDACVQNLEIPVAVKGGVSVEILDNSRQAFVGDRACFKVAVRNSNPRESGTVTLSASGDLSPETTFTENAFALAEGEVRTTDACVDVPADAAAGSHVLNIRALSDMNDASDSVVLTVPSGTAFSVSGSSAGGSCAFVPDVSQLAYLPLTIQNNAATGDYDVELLNQGDLKVTTLQPVLLGFARDSTRNVQLVVDPQNAGAAGQRRFILSLNRDGRPIFQTDVCVSVQGKYGATVSLPKGQLTLVPGDTRVISAAVRNTGNVRDTYYVSVSGIPFAFIGQSSASLGPGEETLFDVVLAPTSANNGAYNGRIQVQSAGASVGAPTVVGEAALTVTVNNPNGANGGSGGTGGNSNLPLVSIADAVRLMRVSDPVYFFAPVANSTVAKIVVSLQNPTGTPLILSASALGLPGEYSWTADSVTNGAAQLDAGSAVTVPLSPGESRNVTFTIDPHAQPTADTSGTLRFSAGGSTRDVPFTLPFSKASSLTGFFTLGLSDFMALAILVAILGVAAGLMLLSARDNYHAALDTGVPKQAYANPQDAGKR